MMTLSETFRLALGTTPPRIQWVLQFCPVVKRPGRATGLSPNFSAEFNKWVEPYLYSQQILLMWTGTTLRPPPPHPLSPYARMDGMQEEHRVTPETFHLRFRRKWMVSFTARPLCSQGKCSWHPLNVGLTSDEDVEEKGNICYSCRESNPEPCSPLSDHYVTVI